MIFCFWIELLIVKEDLDPGLFYHAFEKPSARIAVNKERLAQLFRQRCAAG